jgi:hypothetical protein
LCNLSGCSRILINEGTLTASSVITAIAVAVAALLNALVVGLAGMSYHRRVDKPASPANGKSQPAHHHPNP